MTEESEQEKTKGGYVRIKQNRTEQNKIRQDRTE